MRWVILIAFGLLVHQKVGHFQGLFEPGVKFLGKGQGHGRLQNLRPFYRKAPSGCKPIFAPSRDGSAGPPR